MEPPGLVLFHHDRCTSGNIEGGESGERKTREREVTKTREKRSKSGDERVGGNESTVKPVKHAQ